MEIERSRLHSKLQNDYSRYVVVAKYIANIAAGPLPEILVRDSVSAPLRLLRGLSLSLFLSLSYIYSLARLLFLSRFLSFFHERRFS